MIYGYSVTNKFTGRRYKIFYNTDSFWHCDNPGCHYPGSVRKLGESIIINKKTERKIIDKLTEEVIIINHKVKLSDKKFVWRCTNVINQNTNEKCSGTARYAGFPVWVEDITNYKTTDLIGFAIGSGSITVRKREFCPTKNKRDSLVKYLVDYYENQFCKYDIAEWDLK